MSGLWFGIFSQWLRLYAHTGHNPFFLESHSVLHPSCQVDFRETSGLEIVPTRRRLERSVCCSSPPSAEIDLPSLLGLSFCGAGEINIVWGSQMWT